MTDTSDTTPWHPGDDEAVSAEELGWGSILAAGEATVPARRAELRRLADAARDLSERLVACEADERTLAAAAEALEAAAATLPAGGRSSYDGFPADEADALADPGAFFDHSPLLGRANPVAPPLRLWFEGGRAHARATFGHAYEGPPNCVHGGFVAAAFDEVLGSAQSVTGHPGMTGTLTIRYRRPTPIGTELEFEAGVDRSEGRKLFVSGTVSAHGQVTAEAEGIFITIDRDKFLELRGTDDDRPRSPRSRA